MRTLKLSLSVSALVCAFAATAFAQDPAATDANASATAPAEAPAAGPATASTDSSAVVTTDDTNAGGKVVVGLRLGYGVAMGKVTDSSSGNLSDGIKGQIPIWLDLGYMVTPNILVGLYGQYGFGVLGSDFSDGCDTGGADCSTHDIRLGVQGQYHLQPTEKLDPWFGVGFGYEWLRLSVSGGGDKASETIRGFELLNLQGGFDFKPSPAFGMGPFLSFSLGKYSNYSYEETTSGVTSKDSGSFDNTAIHEWFTFGVRGMFSI